MHIELDAWLEELHSDGIYLAEEPGSGARENLWCISLPEELGLQESDLVEFLYRAMEVRRNLAKAQPVRPATFYAWHDDMAGQLRFSTAHCNNDNLPFGAATVLVADPDEIVREFLDSPYLHGIPWEELKEVPYDEPEESLPQPPPFAVWSVELTS